MGQGGNVFEWQVTDTDLVNDVPGFSTHVIRGGHWNNDSADLSSVSRFNGGACPYLMDTVDFRIASRAIPEPSTLLLLLWKSGGVLSEASLKVALGACATSLCR